MPLLLMMLSFQAIVGLQVCIFCCLIGIILLGVDNQYQNMLIYTIFVDVKWYLVDNNPNKR